MAHGNDASSRPTSWVAVGVMIAGFALGGLGLVLGPTWWMFWAGAVLVALGGIFGVATGIFDDVEVDPHHGPQREPDQPLRVREERPAGNPAPARDAHVDGEGSSRTHG